MCLAPTIVFVPYSPRSFAGIAGDVFKIWPDAELIPLVLVGEQPPDGYRSLAVDESGHFGLFAMPKGAAVAVVANGGPTPLGVAAVLLSQRVNAPLWNVQRDGHSKLNNSPEY